MDETGTALGPPRPDRPARAREPGGEPHPLVEITGAASASAAPGRCFGDDVAAAADLCASLATFGGEEHRPLLDAVDAVDVANFLGRRSAGASEIVLRAAATDDAGRRSRKPCEVEWGRIRGGDPADPEPLFATKAARLVQSLRMFPRLEGLRTVKVAFEDLVVVPTADSPLSRQ